MRLSERHRLHCISFFLFIDLSLSQLNLYYEILKFQLEFFSLSNLRLMTLLMARNSPHLPKSFENFQHRVLLRIYNLTISCRLSNLLQSLKFQVYLFPPSRTFLLNHQYYLNYLMDPIHPHFHNLHLSLIHFIGSHPACKQYCFPGKFDSRL